MAIPKNPRQAMINMMYLVLTAMLALNISSEVLNAFKKVRDGLFITNGQLGDNAQITINTIESRVKSDPAAAPWHAKALEVQKTADGALAELDRVYALIVETSGADDEEKNILGMAEPKNLRDRDTPHLVMINDGEGEKLKAKLDAVRKEFASVYPPDRQQAILEQMTLKVDPPPKGEGGVQKTWEEDNFGEVPTVAALAVIAKLQNDVRTTEVAALEFIRSQIGIENLEFDQLQGRTFPKKSYLNSGETYEADIFVSASSSSVKPVVYIGSLDMTKIGSDSLGQPNKEVKDLDAPPLLPGYTTLPPADAQGIVKYTASATGVGPRKYAGVIEVLNAKTNEKVYYPFESEYLVATSVAVVSPTKMNMFYIGVDNPVEVGVPGYANKDVSATMTAGTITPAGDGQYIVKVTTPGTTKVNVAVKTDKGSRQIGQKEFRVSRIPDPKVMLGTKQGPVISSGEIKSMIGLVALADNFPFDVRFTIRSFNITYKKARDPNLIEKTNTGGVFSEEVKALLSRCGPGDRVWFDDIKVAAPDNTTRSADLSFKIIGG
jgi:hypothetical protein